jgi:hypothetical protein
MTRNDSPLDLAVLRIDIQDDGKPSITIPERRTTLHCPNCKGESFTGYSNDYGLHRVCTGCNFEMDMGGAFISDREWFTTPVAVQPVTKEVVEADEAEYIAEVRMLDRYSGTNRSFMNAWDNDDY